MRLQILLPSHVLIDQEVGKVRAEAEDGEFCLLPRHRDFVAALVPGILTFTTLATDAGRDTEAGLAGEERFVAVDEGILVKAGAEVRVSTRRAIAGADLASLRQTVEEQFEQLDERERQARSAAARMETDFVRRFLQFGEHSHG